MNPNDLLMGGSLNSSAGSINSTHRSRSNRTNRALINGDHSLADSELKRTSHIHSERERRNDLKLLFEALRSNVPELLELVKASKLTILKGAVNHLNEALLEKDKLTTQLDREKTKHFNLNQKLKKLKQENEKIQHLQQGPENSNSNDLKSHHLNHNQTRQLYSQSSYQNHTSQNTNSQHYNYQTSLNNKPSVTTSSSQVMKSLIVH
jgi:hypothetical protein